MGDRDGPQKTIRYLEALLNIAMTSEYPYMHQFRSTVNAGIRSLADKYKPRVFVVDAASALPNG
eukprot:gene32116-39666_t